MRQTTAHCTQLELIGDTVRAHFETELRLAPGQFVLARLVEAFDPYLREPFFPSLIADSGFAIDLARTQPALRFIAPGSRIDLIGPLGSALPDLPARSRVLLAAEANPAALLPLAARAIELGGTATLLLTTRYPLDALQPEIELRVGDLPTLVAEFAASADLIFLHTSPTLQLSLAQRLAEARSFVLASSARALTQCPMPCGTGACGACAVRTAQGWQLACTAGPFFNLADL